ncbi:MAG: YHYH protein, partial [Bacteroidota bacterium]
ANHGFDVGDGDTNNNTGDAADGQLIQTDPKKIFDLTHRGMDFMEQAVLDGVPFYLQISHYAVHTDVECTQASFDYFNAKTPGSLHDNVEYAAMTKDLDDGLGQIMQKIEDLNIENETYIIFLSDNGGATNQTNNSPLSRSKDFITEGGIRVPMIISGPNVAIAYCDEAVNGYDLFPTIAALSNGTESLPSTLDGKDLTPLFSQSNFERGNAIYFHSPHYGSNDNKQPKSAIIEGQYKLVIDYEACNIDLFDLEADIGESRDVAQLFPQLTNRLLVQLRDYLKAVDANMPTLNPAFFTGTANDLDADGLDDTWEIENLLCYEYSGVDDPDGDGRDNATEEMEGTDPLSGLVINLKAMLEGPFNPSQLDMTTELQAQLPLIGPYLGTAVNSIPAEVVDWILVKLSDTTNQQNLIVEQEFFLRKDGQVVDENGNENLYFEGFFEDAGLLSIHHRNHLDIRGSEAIALTKSTTLYCANNSEISPVTDIQCTTVFDPDSIFIDISVSNDIRTISTNNYPNHNYFVGAGQLATMFNVFEMDATPTIAATTTSILRPNNRPRYLFGVGLNGVIFAPAPATPFIFEDVNTREYNWDWVFEPTMNQGDGSDKVALDCSGAHTSTAQGYHYHANTVEYAETFLAGISDSTVPTTIEEVHIGWAADGFPILYRYGPDGNGGFELLQSSYQIKQGERPGDGVSEPCGEYNGKYTNDWEYISTLGDLDDCNGIQRNVTINGQIYSYFYVVTDHFPQVSRCFKGTPDNSFR